VGDTTTSTDHGDVQAILEQRARALARPLAAEEPQDLLDLVVVMLGSERYGIDIGCVREVQPLSVLTRVPAVPAWWAGIVNVRGTLHPVLDPRFLLSLPTDDTADERKVVLVWNDRVCVGLLVDNAPAVCQVAEHEIGPALAGTPDAVRPMLRGVTSDLLTVLDVKAMLSDPALAVRHEQSERGVQR
jgi:purine-binding chemotaxis protein CheW